jgi:hypothetical protein
MARVRARRPGRSDTALRSPCAMRPAAVEASGGNAR